MNDAKEKARIALQDAVYYALESGMTSEQILEEIRYALDTAE